MPLPNFIVIGVAKAATTSVYSYAAQHPEIFMSPTKETNYFALYGRPPAFAGPADRTIVNRQSVFRREDYEAQFDGRSTEPVAGEASPRYMAVSEVPDRIAADIPHCRIVVGLRHPVDRAFAAWSWIRMRGIERLPFDEAIGVGAAREAADWSWGNYLRLSHYADQLERYLAVFPRDQLHVYLYEDFAHDPVEVMRGIFRFLGVDASFAPNTRRRHARSGVITNRGVRKIWEASGGLREVIRPGARAASEVRIQRHDETSD